MQGRSKDKKRGENKGNNKKKLVKRVDGISIFVVLLWVGLRARTSLFSSATWTALLAVPLGINLCAIAINLFTPSLESLSVYNFSSRIYWHPYCTLLGLLALIFVDLPNLFLNFVGAFLILAIFVWAFIMWLKKGGLDTV